MWPWEHAAVAYICYSLLARLGWGRTPTALETVLVLVGSQLPDLIDKPLAWWLHVLPSGRSLGHSLFFALPLVAAVFWAMRVRRRFAAGIAFVVGYLSHLPGDVFYGVLLGGRPSVYFLFYPVVPQSTDATVRAVPKITRLFTDFLGFLVTPRGLLYLGGELVLVGGALLLWVLDGKPGFGRVRRQVRRAIVG